MERLTNRKEAEAQQKSYDRRIRQGYPRNIPEERFLRLAAWESLFDDTGLTPDELSRAAELVKAEKEGRVARFPFVAMVEQSLQDGKMTPQKDQKFNGRYAVVYFDKEKWASPLIDICGRPYNREQAEARMATLTRAEAEAALHHPLTET